MITEDNYLHEEHLTIYSNRKSSYNWQASCIIKGDQKMMGSLSMTCSDGSANFCADNTSWILEVLYPTLKQYICDPIETSQSIALQKDLANLLGLNEVTYEEMLDLYGLLYFAKEKGLLNN